MQENETINFKKPLTNLPRRIKKSISNFKLLSRKQQTGIAVFLLLTLSIPLTITAALNPTIFWTSAYEYPITPPITNPDSSPRPSPSSEPSPDPTPTLKPSPSPIPSFTPPPEPSPSPSPPSSAFPSPIVSAAPSPTPNEYSSFPTIQTRRFRSALVNKRYKATMKAKDPDPGDHITVTITNLPPGVTTRTCKSITSTSGTKISCTISGKPTLPGTYIVVVSIRDLANNVKTKLIPLTIYPSRPWYNFLLL